MYPLHPITGDYADFTEAELAAFRESLRNHGIMVPIVTWRGQIVDGRHRARLRALNQHRRANTKPLTTAEKRARIEAALKANPELSNLAIAKMLGVDDKTVASVRAELDGRSEIPNVGVRTDTKGRQQPARKPRPSASEAKRNQRVERSHVAQEDLFQEAVPAPAAASPLPATAPCTDQRPTPAAASAPLMLETAPPGPQAEVPSLPDPVRGCLEAILASAAASGQVPAGIDFNSVDKAIEVFRSWWKPLALRQIEETERVDQIKKIIIETGLLETYYGRTGKLDAKHEAREIRLRAEQRGGHLLIKMEKEGLRTRNRHGKGCKIGTATSLATLEKLGVTKNDSWRWQQISKLPKPKFAALLTQRSRPRRGRRRRVKLNPPPLAPVSSIPGKHLPSEGHAGLPEPDVTLAPAASQDAEPPHSTSSDSMIT